MPKVRIKEWIELAVPSIVLAPEEDSRGDISLFEHIARDIENHNNSKLEVYEDKNTDLNIGRILEDSSMYESEDEIDPNHFKI